MTSPVPGKPRQKMALIVTFLVVLQLALSSAQISRFPGQTDEITELPGIPRGVSFKQYSGYLRASNTKFLHYWFVESARSPELDPVVLWLNGGPGCSSMEGMLTENGPFQVDAAGENLILNPYSWNKIANVLYIEAPAGVGYSYATDGNVTTDDDVTAENNHAALMDFFRLFPLYQQNAFYVTGESYGGVYVPTLMTRLLKDKTFNLKGGAIGNGVFNREYMADSKLKYFYYHGLIGSEVYDAMVESCCRGKVTECFFFPFTSNQCQQAVAAAYIEVLRYHINNYNILSPCEGLVAREGNLRSRRTSRLVALTLKSAMHTFTDHQVKASIQELIQEDESNPPCTAEENVEHWINREDVRKALHIRQGLPQWKLCSADINGKTYRQQYSNMVPFVKEILADKDQRLLLYSGDLDSVCDFLGTQRFVDGLRLQEVAGHEAWHYISPQDGTMQVGGFWSRYQQLDFVTVRGSGHMVPTDQPAAAFHMIRSFLQPPSSLNLSPHGFSKMASRG